MKNDNKRKLLLPLLGIFLMILNYSRLTGTENIRPIHIVTLLVLGALIGILLTNIVSIIKEYRG